MKILVNLVIEKPKGMTIKDVEDWVKTQVRASGFLMPEDPAWHMRNAVRSVHARSLDYAEPGWDEK